MGSRNYRPERTAPPRDEKAFAKRLTQLLRNEEEWLLTVYHNRTMSDRVFSDKDDDLEYFVNAVSGLAGLGEGAA